MTRVTVVECDDSWRTDDGKQAWPTAADAERAIRASAQPGVLLIDWVPTTRVGFMVVKAIVAAAS